MKKAIICMNPNGLNDEELEEMWSTAVEFLRDKGYELLEWDYSLAMDGKPDLYDAPCQSRELNSLSHDIDEMSRRDAIYFCGAWMCDPNCQLQYLAAKMFDSNLTIYYENGNELSEKMKLNLAVFLSPVLEPILHLL